MHPTSTEIFGPILNPHTPAGPGASTCAACGTSISLEEMEWYDPNFKGPTLPGVAEENMPYECPTPPSVAEIMGRQAAIRTAWMALVEATRTEFPRAFFGVGTVLDKRGLLRMNGYSPEQPLSGSLVLFELAMAPGATRVVTGGKGWAHILEDAGIDHIWQPFS